jgi:hypothetical protein
VFSVIALGSPVDRPSTAQGIVGASGTLGFVIASLVAGAAGRDQHPPAVLPVRRRP